MVSFGTDAAERFVGWDALRESMIRQNEATEGIQVAVSKQVVKVHSSGTVAWMSHLADWSLVASGEAVELTGMRVTGVLEKRDGNWVFVQFHISAPISGQAFEC